MYIERGEKTNIYKYRRHLGLEETVEAIAMVLVAGRQLWSAMLLSGSRYNNVIDLV